MVSSMPNSNFLRMFILERKKKRIGFSMWQITRTYTHTHAHTCTLTKKISWNESVSSVFSSLSSSQLSCVRVSVCVCMISSLLDANSKLPVLICLVFGVQGYSKISYNRTFQYKCIDIFFSSFFYCLLSSFIYFFSVEFSFFFSLNCRCLRTLILLLKNHHRAPK